jgi:O-antigen/teichoic acid export membrane protein
MKIPIGKLVHGAVWTIGAFGLSQVLRVVTSVVLARLLAPQLFGLMLIVNTISTGIQLIADIGIGQNIIYSKNAAEPEYYNTAWTLQIIRSVALWFVFLIVAVPAAKFYDIPILSVILPLSGLSIIFGGFTSVGPAILQKRMDFAKLNIYTLAVGAISSANAILLAYLSPTIWALVVGGVAGSAIPMVASYFLLPDIKQRFYISKQYAWDIVGFGKWIFVSSIVYFLSNNYDRLYFAKVVPLELLGIYGIARSISELLGLVALRLGNFVIFPFIASHENMPRESLRQQLISIRWNSLLLMALGCSFFVATADLAILLLYDQRYHAASWMLPILLIAAWFSMLSAINESTLLGLGMPSYSAIANGVRFAFLAFGLPLGFETEGLPGAIMTLGLIEVCRYVAVWVGQKRERFSFARQDLTITIAMFMMIGLWEWLRWVAGFGTSFDTFRESLQN